MYEYKAFVLKIIDGDTIDVDLDLGFKIHTKQRLRLYGINTPEIRGEEREEGLKSKKFVESHLPVGKEILVKTQKDKTGKYGRYLATIIVDGVNLNELLIAEGLAERYKG